MTQKTVAEIFVETLVAAGVTRIYGVVGDSLNGILEQIRRNKKIEWIGVRHEETGAFAAGAQAHLTGELAVCAGSCGPGNMHLINGLYDCHRSRVPVLALAAQIPSQFTATGGQLDFVRGAYASKGGLSIIAFQSSIKNGTISKIVSRLSGPVTTPRTDTHYVVTENGVVNLKGLSSTERALALINLADPAFRENLPGSKHMREISPKRGL